MNYAYSSLDSVDINLFILRKILWCPLRLLYIKELLNLLVFFLFAHLLKKKKKSYIILPAHFSFLLCLSSWLVDYIIFTIFLFTFVPYADRKFPNLWWYKGTCMMTFINAFFNFILYVYISNISRQMHRWTKVQICPWPHQGRSLSKIPERYSHHALIKRTYALLHGMEEYM